MPRSAPDQKRLSNSSASRLAALNTRALRKMITQLMNEPASSSSTMIFTGRLALIIRSR
ncbi:hypothetical protein D3C73_1649520 [compost metagenome]